jgi:hypothetical protein
MYLDVAIMDTSLMQRSRAATLLVNLETNGPLYFDITANRRGPRKVSKDTAWPSPKSHEDFAPNNDSHSFEN